MKDLQRRLWGGSGKPSELFAGCLGDPGERFERFGATPNGRVVDFETLKGVWEVHKTARELFFEIPGRQIHNSHGFEHAEFLILRGP